MVVAVEEEAMAVDTMIEVRNPCEVYLEEVHFGRYNLRRMYMFTGGYRGGGGGKLLSRLNKMYTGVER